jgi:hypothetical protein
VALAVGASRNERGNVLSRLASADGYTVFDRRGRRVGTFIELAGASGEEIAIRHDAVFLWHRRVLPLTTVATVFPEHGAVVLNVDRRAASTPVGVRPVADTPSADGADARAFGYRPTLSQREGVVTAVGAPPPGSGEAAVGDARSGVAGVGLGFEGECCFVWR